jgi:hypothetical protein
MSKKYSKMKKVIWEGARTGVLTSMILVGSALGGRTALAQVNPEYTASVTAKNASGMHIGHRFNSPTKVASLAIQLGLDPQAVKQELQSGKTIKQILQENGITMDQLDQ